MININVNVSSAEELAKVMAYLAEHPAEGGLVSLKTSINPTIPTYVGSGVPEVRTAIKNVVEECAKNSAAQANEQIKDETPVTAYTLDALTEAAGRLAEAGHRQEIVNLINSFGAKKMSEVKPEDYSAFAEKLREMGGKI